MTVRDLVSKFGKIGTVYYLEKWFDDVDDYRTIYHGVCSCIPDKILDTPTSNYIVGREYTDTDCITLYLA